MDKQDASLRGINNLSITRENIELLRSNIK